MAVDWRVKNACVSVGTQRKNGQSTSVYVGFGLASAAACFPRAHRTQSSRPHLRVTWRILPGVLQSNAWKQCRQIVFTRNALFLLGTRLPTDVERRSACVFVQPRFIWVLSLYLQRTLCTQFCVCLFSVFPPLLYCWLEGRWTVKWTLVTRCAGRGGVYLANGRALSTRCCIRFSTPSSAR